MKVSKVTRAPEGVEAGYGSYFGARPRIAYGNYGTKLRIGRYTSIAAGFTAILGGNHPICHITQFPFGKYGNGSSSKGDIVIGSDCWLGHGVTVLSGVTIGDGATVGAFSVVAKDVKPYEIVAGNPIRHLRYRFSEEQIKKLLEICWWDWTEEEVAAATGLLFTDNIEAFLERYHG